MVVLVSLVGVIYGETVAYMIYWYGLIDGVWARGILMLVA
jgi:hypothetical protein